MVAPTRRFPARATPLTSVIELMTVADDEAVAFEGTVVRRWDGLEADTPYDIDGVSFRTLPRLGERLATVATLNDVHFGETECGKVEGSDIGPVLSSEPGEAPYPEVMNRAAAAEIGRRRPDLVVAKGDLTASGRPEEFAAFDACYGGMGPLVAVRGNHDTSPSGAHLERVQEVTLPGVIVSVLDTSISGLASGGVAADQLAWLDELGARADRPVLVFGHHHPWSPDSAGREPGYFGINPDDSEALVEVVARRPRLLGYFAGHTHRNRVRRFSATGEVPYVEVSATKDFPGVWAEYRVFDGGVLQVVHRIADTAALAWTERTRALYAGLYPQYSLGALEDRCFAVPPR